MVFKYCFGLRGPSACSDFCVYINGLHTRGAQGLLVHRSRLEVEVEEAAARRTAKLPSYMKPTASSATKVRLPCKHCRTYNR